MQETYAVGKSVICFLHTFAACNEFSQLTNHKNTMYMLSPYRFQQKASWHIVHKT